MTTKRHRVGRGKFSRHTSKHGALALSSAEAVRKAEPLLGREYEVRSWSGKPEVNYLSGLVGFYVVGTRSDGRLRTVFVPYGGDRS